MPPTRISSLQIGDGQVKRSDLNTADSGAAVITRVIAGDGVAISETGADPGTGDVTISATGGGAMTGEIRLWSLPALPTGWAWCDGAALTDASALRTAYLAAGSPYGETSGDPHTPDMRGRFPIGAEAATDHALGDTGGAEAWGVDVDSNTFEGSLMNETLTAFTGGGTDCGIFSPDGSGDKRPPYLALNYIVKL